MKNIPQKKLTLFLLLFFVVSINFLFAQNKTFNFYGKVSGFAGRSLSNSGYLFSGRYLPSLGINIYENTDYFIDFEASGNLYYQTDFDTINNSDVDFYRFWSRYSTNQFEARLGLQKINFGPAFLFRPLMWFASSDPQDPLSLSKGVWGLRLRYYFLNNANIWAWALYGNNDRKGMEMFPTKDNTIEYGGRIQVPILNGEFGITYHNRHYETNNIFLLPEDDNFNENRFALDGKWDVEIGLWFEAEVINSENYLPKWQEMITVGSDYTIPLGNGLHILGEYFYMNMTDDFFEIDNDYDFAGLSIDYPIGLFDMVNGFIYCDVENMELFNYFSWRRTYNKFSINLSYSWMTSDDFQSINNNQSMLMLDNFVKLMIIYNY
ncbi:MAG: hypothetical protein U9R41_08450 [Candidatus Marinimicrobia bacterium]|nr:hypothetical protein [Candidatus Neomarinimicrobiota bacterium]